MPYARFQQEVRLAAEKIQETDRSEWVRTAFLTWNMRSLVAGKKVGSFQRFLRDLGLAPKVELDPTRLDSEKRRAYANVEKVREAFKRPRA